MNETTARLVRQDRLRKLVREVIAECAGSMEDEDWGDASERRMFFEDVAQLLVNELGEA